MCARLCGALQNKLITLWASGAAIIDKTHTKYVQMAGLDSIQLNSLCLKWTRAVGRKSDVCQYIVLKWQTGAWALNVNQRTKREEKITHSS